MSMRLPSCCRQEMRINLESPRFVEAICQKCRDIVYIKKHIELRPQLIDD